MTYTSDLSSRLIGDPSDHPDTRALIDGLGACPPEPGQISYIVGSDRFHWFVPLAVPSAEQSSAVRTRGLVVSLSLLSEVVDLFDGERGITRAEKRLLFQLVCGASPREAADADGVSFETKRAQVKSASAKLGCRGQTELVRRIMGQLVHLLNLANADTSMHARQRLSSTSIFRRACDW